jgi:hypothetical protein
VLKLNRYGLQSKFLPENPLKLQWTMQDDHLLHTQTWSFHHFLCRTWLKNKKFERDFFAFVFGRAPTIENAGDTTVMATPQQTIDR